MNPFQNIGGRRPMSSKFDLSHTRKFSFAPGRLYPILCAEAVPSDVFNYSTSALVRMMPMQAPVMHLVDVCVHSFFYPERLTQRRDLYEVFQGGGKDGDGKDAQGNTIQAPFFLVKGGGGTTETAIDLGEYLGAGTLADYLGIAYSNAAIVNLGTQAITARPFIAFWRIWCEYFRDQNLHNNWAEEYPEIFDSVGGDITAAIFNAMEDGFQFFDIPHVCWEKDYFTSALPQAQRGLPVETPLTGTAQVTYKDIAVTTEVPFTAGDVTVNGTGDILIPGSPGAKTTGIDNIESVELTSGGFSINDLRVAARLQEYLEKMMRGGYRYIEVVKQIFGVTSSDARLQRAEYLGGGKIPVHISEVLQTSENGTTPLAEMAGHGVAAGDVTNFRKFTEEHGYYFSFIFMRPKTAYQQGLPRMFFDRFDRLAYAIPSFAHLGEQEVYVKELYWQCDPSADNTVFGYQQKYAEYKYIPSTVHGEFKSTLDFWHWGSIYENVPALDLNFVECQPSMRIFNVVSENSDPCYCIVNNRLIARRPLPYHGDPYL